MMKVQFNIPVVTHTLETPKIQPQAMAHSRPYVDAPPHPKAADAAGHGQLVDGWKQIALAKMAELLGKYRSLPVFLDACVKCGACTDKCHYFLGSADAKNMPVARQDLLRSVYRRYFTLAGKWFPWLVGARELTEEVMHEWYSYYHQCSECRRCSVYCPFGIDTAEITMAGREICASVGLGQKYANRVIDQVHRVGNNLGLPKAALADTLSGLEQDIEEDIGVAVKLPLDQKGAEILLVTPSADFFAEPHVDGLIGCAKVLHQAGLSWTISSYASEAANFGLFTGNYDHLQRIAERIRRAALELGVKRIVYGECGHAWRVGYSFLNTLAGPFDFLDANYPIPQHICELTHTLIADRQLRLNPSVHDDKVVTFHDSCNVARGSSMGNRPNGQFIVPREILQAVCRHYVDMSADSIGDATFCCGGGGGLLTDELLEIRVKGALPRMTALQRVIEHRGVTHMAVICAICKSQFYTVLPLYRQDPNMIISLHQLVGDALVWDTRH